jgi:predicted DsbA family dithiol-disulfide isomerase
MPTEFNSTPSVSHRKSRSRRSRGSTGRARIQPYAGRASGAVKRFLRHRGGRDGQRPPPDSIGPTAIAGRADAQGITPEFHVATFEQLKRTYVDTGQVRFVSRDLPLDMHKHALGAAHAARCAGEQGRYWDMRQALIVNATRLAPDHLRTYAQDLGLEMARFEECVASGRYARSIERDIADARAAGITGTPSSVRGRSSRAGVAGIKLVGALPSAAFEAKIREALARP